MTIPPLHQDANVVICPSRDTTDCGDICAAGASAAGVKPGPIRLLHGDRRVFGLAHIEQDDRLRAISGRGYATGQAFVFDVAAKWTQLHKGATGRITVAVQCTAGFNAIVLQWQDDSFWSVVTALPYRRPKEPLVFQKERSDGSEPRPALAARPRFETLTLPKREGS